MPVLYVIAGPNGIGKTTSSFDLVPAGIPVINSDEIAKELRLSGRASVNTQEYSNREAIQLMETHRRRQLSFAIETNLADTETWKFLLEVQKTGYILYVKYLSTDRLDLLNGRIAERYRQGEHYIRPDIVKERYVNGLNLLNHYFPKPDFLELIDNSNETTLVAEIAGGRILRKTDPLPDWVKTYLGQHFHPKPKQRESPGNMSVEEIRKEYRKKIRGSGTS
jgi:predicted ABC-type ATPase